LWVQFTGILPLFIIIVIINDSIYPAVSKASRTGNKVSCQPNDCPNRWVFKRRLKVASDGAETMSAAMFCDLGFLVSGGAHLSVFFHEASAMQKFGESIKLEVDRNRFCQFRP